ncbi:MAG: hypothetical protein JWR04_599 [Rhodoglobus sp.]|nr:hypothetical protein [Rhodoglobus sp.]
MTCFYCGTELPAGAMFCGECGRPVNTKGGRSSKASSKAAPEAVVPVPREEPAAPEPVVEASAPPEPEPVAEPLPEPEAAPAAVAEPEPLPEPAPAAEAEPLPEIEPDLPPLPELPADVNVAAVADRCAQCGAPLAASDIFCPECGFVRQRESAPARPSDTNILDPFPWGLPRSTESVTNHLHAPVATDVAAKPFAEIADVSETRLVPRGPRGERFVLQFSTGESVSVSGTGLIGRNPVAEPGEYFDTLVAVIDPGRSVSKTHLEFGQDDTSFWVSDRYSGNGTVVREPDREPRRCEAGKRYRVARGARVEIGEQFFIVS